MSSAFRSSLPELLAQPECRAARRGRPFLILDEALAEAFLWNAAGARVFGVTEKGVLPVLLARQLGSSARVLAERGAAALILRAPVGRASQPIAATATRLAAGGTTAVLLFAGNGEEADGVEPQRLLAALASDGDDDALFHADGRFAAGADRGDVAAEAVARFAARDAASETLDAEGQRVRFLRVDDDLVLVRGEPAETARPASAAEDAAGEPSPAAQPAPGVAAPSIAALVGRWQDRRGGDDSEAPASPLRLRSNWGVAPTAGSGETMPSEPAAAEPDLPHLAEEASEDRSGGEAAAFVPCLDAAPVRFVWQIDADGRFRSFSPEFAETVGPRAADVVGQTFAAVAEALGLDENGAIRRLLERRDTWSGRTVLWPVENTDRRVPIDLAALPTYSRGRAFDGFRGFGIIRSVDHEADPHARGLALAVRLAERDAPAEPDGAPDAPPATRPLFRTFEADLPGVSFGRRQTPLRAEGDNKVVRLAAEQRRRASDATLSEAEEAAFREIGAKLGQRSEAETPGALRFESAMPPAVPAEAPRTAPPAPQADYAAAERVEAAPTTPNDEGREAEPIATDMRAILAPLPVPAVVQARDALVFANRAFLDFAGYEDVEALNRAGGLDALFAEGVTDAEAVLVRRASGEAVETRVHLQRIAFAGRSSLLMTFEQRPDAAPPVETGSAELRREIGELQAVLDIATDGVVLVDPSGAIRAANGSAEALFGTGEADLRGRPVASLFAHESQKAVLDYLETLKDKGLAGIMNDGREVIGRVAQGGFVPLFITVGRLSEERGWCVVIRDMSHWKRIEEELVNAKRAAEAASLHKSRFLANISHELRTPLNAIIGFADVMASECFGPIGSERYIEYLGDIKRSGHHVLDLVNDLLDISKIEAGKMELTFESVSLNEVLAEVVSTMQPQANRERVIVRSNLPASVPPVVADRRTIRQIALNLLSNSVRFTPAGGQIIASTTYTAEGSVLLRVRDSGVGMTAREIEIALTPFQQVQRPGDGRAGGTGLGLPLTKAMAEANRASFAIRSTPGEGTLVEIAFPSPRVLAD